MNNMEQSKILNDWNKAKIKPRELKDNVNTDLFVKALKSVMCGYVDKEVLENFYK